MKLLLSGLFWLALFAPLSVSAGDLRGFLTLSGGERVYVDYVKPEPGKGVLVLLNGLTYSTHSWNSFVREFEKRGTGFGILRYDMRGMGKTLLEGELPVNYEIPHEAQVEQLRRLLDRLGLKRVHLAGLSYGGGIAVAFGNKYPRYVESLILMAPFTQALENQDNWIKAQVAWTRVAQPWNPASDDELYDFYLRQFVYSTYPSAEPVVLENPYKLEAVFRMVQGIRKFRAVESLGRVPAGSVHLVVAREDQYIPRHVMNEFWAAVPLRKRGSRIDISWSEHKIPEAIPAYSSAWVAEIVQGNAKIARGREFQGSVWDGNAVSGEIVVELRE